MKMVLFSIIWTAGVVFFCSLHSVFMLIYLIFSWILVSIWNNKMDCKL